MNSRFRKVNQFFVMSDSGKKQSAFNVLMAEADLDKLENCEVEMSVEIERGEQRNCDKTDLIGQSTKKRRRQVRLRYSEFTPHQAFKFTALKEGAVTAPTGTVANEVQTLTRSGTVNGGTFVLGLTLEGRTGSTKAIPYDAPAAAIQAAIVDQAKTLGKIIKPGDVVVTGIWGTGIVMTFGKRLRNANLPLLSVDNSDIDGGGTIVNTQTTQGGNKYHTAQRSADGTKPHTTFAAGDKAGSIATQKYGDAVISSVDITASNEQANPQMVVVVDCHFLTQETTEFEVPECINTPGVRAEDIRLKFNGTFEHRDLVNDSVSLNDNVPLNAAHRYDDPDITVPFVRGNQPSQQFQTELFGNANHPLRSLALNQAIEGNEIETIRYYGNPGNRFTIIAPETKIKPQGNQLDDFSGEADESTIKIAGTPYGITDIPVTYEAYLDQTVSFLGT